MRYLNSKTLFWLLAVLIVTSCLPVKVPPQNYTQVHNAIKKSKFFPSVRSTFSPRNKNNLNINIKGNVELAVTLKFSDSIFEGYQLGWCGKQDYKQPAVSNQYSESIQKIDCKINSEKRRITSSLNKRLAGLVRNIKLLGDNGLHKESNDIYIWLYLPVLAIHEKYLVDYEDPNQVIATPLDDTGLELVITKTDLAVIAKTKDDRIPQAIIKVPKTFHGLAEIDWSRISDKKIISSFQLVSRKKIKSKEVYGEGAKLPMSYFDNIFLMKVR